MIKYTEEYYIEGNNRKIAQIKKSTSNGITEYMLYPLDYSWKYNAEELIDILNIITSMNKDISQFLTPAVPSGSLLEQDMRRRFPVS
jgi:hypothetical protein